MTVVAVFLWGDAILKCQMNGRVPECVCALVWATLKIMRLGAKKSRDLLQFHCAISCLSRLCLYFYDEKQSYVLTRAYCKLRQMCASRIMMSFRLSLESNIFGHS